MDISGMTHLWAVSAVHACLGCGLRTAVVYTEAASYYPHRSVERRLVRAWRTGDIETAAQYLQSQALGGVHILPAFSGNFRAGRQTCLMLFAGYEPNRAQGLVESYGPSAVIVFYGVSPHRRMQWRTGLSRRLHEGLFERWYTRESELSTFRVDEIAAKLQQEAEAIQDQYDIAISPLCSKMQGMGIYQFWRAHPATQLVFSSPVRFNPSRYSKGVGRTYVCEMT